MDRPGLVLLHEPVRDHPDAARVTLEGSVDPKTVNRFKDELQALAVKGTKRFLIDCAKLTYINSSGLAYLLNLVSLVKTKGGMIALTAVDSKILVIFNMMGITALFQFYPSYGDALRELDQKLARELRDVGPALKLEEPPPPAAPSSTRALRALPASRPGPRTDRIPRASRPIPLAPPINPIVQFFRSLFGLDDDRPSRIRRKRR